MKEHVRKTVPSLVQRTNDLVNFRNKLQGSSFDLDYSLDAIVKMSRADTTLEVIFNLLLTSVSIRLNLNLIVFLIQSNQVNSEFTNRFIICRATIEHQELEGKCRQ